MNKYSFGYSFIELIFILLISSLISLYGMSAITTFWQDQNKFKHILKLEQAIVFAKNYAITQHATVILQAIDQNWDNGILIKTNNSTILHLSKIPKDHHLTLKAFPTSVQLQFNSTGLLNADNGTFTYTLPNHKKSYLKISKTGRVRYETN
jgi:Tfp pilus assembly protein FimT